MLVLSRKTGEKVIIGGAITITIIRASRSRIRLGVEAPDGVEILRSELVGREPGRAPGQPVKKPR
jgi:carbon storage regulator